MSWPRCAWSVASSWFSTSRSAAVVSSRPTMSAAKGPTATSLPVASSSSPNASPSAPICSRSHGVKSRASSGHTVRGSTCSMLASPMLGIPTGLLNRRWSGLVVVHLDDRFPGEPGGIAHRQQARAACAVEHHVQPVVLPQAPGGAKLVGGQRDHIGPGPPLDLDEADKARVWVAGEQVEAAVLGLHALGLAAVLALVALCHLNGDPL